MLETKLRESLRALVEAYCEAVGCAPSRVSRLALRDDKWIGKVLDPESGFNFSVRSCDTMIIWLSSNWPAGVKWPKSVERPKP